MADEWAKAARNLTDEERVLALRNLLELASEPESGIIRQLLGDERKPLSQKQEYVYRAKIEPSLVEKCMAPGCTSFTVAGSTYCPTCDIEYGSG